MGHGTYVVNTKELVRGPGKARLESSEEKPRRGKQGRQTPGRLLKAPNAGTRSCAVPVNKEGQVTDDASEIQIAASVYI